MVRKRSRLGVGSGMDMSSGEMEIEASVSTGGDAVRKSPVGRVGRRVGIAGDGVHC